MLVDYSISRSLSLSIDLVNLSWIYCCCSDGLLDSSVRYWAYSIGSLLDEVASHLLVQFMWFTFSTVIYIYQLLHHIYVVCFSIDLIYMLYWFMACSVILLLASLLVYLFRYASYDLIICIYTCLADLVCRKFFKSSRFRLSPYFQHGIKAECVVRTSVAAWRAYVDPDSEGLSSIAQPGRVSPK